MVVLSVSICTKNGKALVARQFVEMARIRIEGLLAAFPKLLGSDSKQHTYVETESVRYVYQLLVDNIYLLLITNRASNIIEDLETLKLLSKVIPDIAGMINNLTEEKISEKCFDLIFAFDEVITAGGYREPISLAQIRTNMEMDSHEEKLHKMIKQSKMDTAKDQAKEASKSIAAKQKELGRSGMVGIGSDSYSSMSAYTENSPDMYSAGSSSATSTPYGMTGGTGTGAPSPGGITVAPKAVKGISLMGGQTKGKSLEDALIKEDKLAPALALKSKAATASESVMTQAPAVQHPIMLQVVERVTATISRDGSISLFEIKGSLTLTANSDESALCSVQMNTANIAHSTDFIFTTHPKVNKPLYDKTGLLQLKDITKGFPSARPVGVLKWTHTGVAGADNALLPVKINCWPDEESRGVMNVSIEYSKELNKLTLSNLRIKMPLGTASSPNILSVDGSYKHNATTQELLWEIPLVDASNATGTLEFNIHSKNPSPDAFFPIDVEFSSNEMFCDIDVATVKTADGKSPILYGLTKSMSTEGYIIE